jgi:hypothetical protein
VKACPNCGADLSGAKRLVAVSARDLVESLRLDADLLAWCARTAPDFDAADELDAFKDRMRANKYKTNQGPVADAAAAFRTHMRNAVKFGHGRAVRPSPSNAQRSVAPRKDL